MRGKIKMVGFNLDIPDEQHGQFKANCALEGVDMSDKILTLLKLYNEDRKSNRMNK